MKIVLSFLRFVNSCPVPGSAKFLCLDYSGPRHHLSSEVRLSGQVSPATLRGWMDACAAWSSPKAEPQGTSWKVCDVTTSPSLVLDPSNLVLKTCGFVLVQILILGNLSLAEKAASEASGAVCCLNDISVCLYNAGWQPSCRSQGRFTGLYTLEDIEANC